MAAPPVLTGAVQDSATCAFPAVPVGAAGAAGNVRGVIDADSGEKAPWPALFVAATRKT